MLCLLTSVMLKTTALLANAHRLVTVHEINAIVQKGTLTCPVLQQPASFDRIFKGRTGLFYNRGGDSSSGNNERPGEYYS